MRNHPVHFPLDIIHDEAWIHGSRVRAQTTINISLLPSTDGARVDFLRQVHRGLSDHILYTAMSRCVVEQKVGTFAISYNLDCVVYTAADFQALMQEQYERGFHAAQLRPMEAPTLETRKPVDLAEGGG